MTIRTKFQTGLYLIAVVFLAACGEGGGGATGSTPEYYVNVATGSDTNLGTSAQPFKTITKVMTVATNGSLVHVSPGTYNEASGESFPILVPDGVILQGDEANKGAGGTPTVIIGGGQATFYAAGFIGATIEPGTGSTIAGFTITNNNNTGISFPIALVVRTGSNVTIRNNTLTGTVDDAIYLTGGTVNHVIADNRIVNNSGLAIGFIGGGVGSKVENNVITGNLNGVEYDTPGGDLGGGSAGSVGGNVISCNTRNDIWTNLGSSETIAAANNFWDHNPPTVGCASGNDFCSRFDGATISTTGAALAPSPCP